MTCPPRRFVHQTVSHVRIHIMCHVHIRRRRELDAARHALETCAQACEAAGIKDDAEAPIVRMSCTSCVCLNVSEMRYALFADVHVAFERKVIREVARDLIEVGQKAMSDDS